MVPKRSQVDCEQLARFFEHHGFARRRQKGSHLSIVKLGVVRPIAIPMHGDVSIGVVQSNLRTAGLTRDELIEWLACHRAVPRIRWNINR
jgi:predicted RNA binding protein YcfA (HicA-like mRNA interferase family)